MDVMSSPKRYSHPRFFYSREDNTIHTVEIKLHGNIIKTVRGSINRNKTSGYLTVGTPGHTFVGHDDVFKTEKQAIKRYEEMIKSLSKTHTETHSIDRFTEEESHFDPEVHVIPIVREPGFRAWRPSEYSPDVVKEVERGQAILVKEPEGFPVIIFKERGIIRVRSSDNMERHPHGGLLIDRAPDVCDMLDNFRHMIPDNSLLVGYLVATDPDTEDPGKWVRNSLGKEVNTGDDISLCLLDILIWGGKAIGYSKPYYARLNLVVDLVQSMESDYPTDGLSKSMPDGHDMRELFKKTGFMSAPILEPDTLCVPPSIRDAVTYIKDYCKRNGWVKILAIHPTLPFGKEAWSVSGKGPRCGSVIAIELCYEDYFIGICNSTSGYGKKEGELIAEIELYQIDDKGNATYRGTCDDWVYDVDDYEDAFKEGVLVKVAYEQDGDKIIDAMIIDILEESDASRAAVIRRI